MWEIASAGSTRLLVAVIMGLACSACGPDDSKTTAPPQASPPGPCTAAASSTPFCSQGSSDGGTCPLLADDIITCPGNGVVTSGLSATGSIGMASAPGRRGDLVFATASSGGDDPQEYVELGAFAPTGSATFTLDTFPPSAFYEGGGGSNAGLLVVTNAQGAPIILSSIGGALTAAIGSASSGGTFSVESALAAPDNGEGWAIAGAVVEPAGAVDVLAQSGSATQLARRDTSGHWTSSPLPYSISPAIGVDAKGVVYTAGWVTASAAGMEQLEIAVGSSAPAVVTTVAEMDVTVLDLAVGQNPDGSALPVVAFGSTLTLAVPDGSGGFTTIQPMLSVAQPYQDGCGGSLSLGNCSCPQTCSRTGDQAGWLQLVRDAQGDVYVAWLEVDTNMVYPVTLNSTSVGGQMITCSCDPDLQSGMGSSTALGLQLDRLVTSPTPHTEHRGTIPVPSESTAFQAVDGNGTIQLLAASTGGAMRRVVLDASQLP